MQNENETERKQSKSGLSGFIFGMVVGAAVTLTAMTFRGNAAVVPAAAPAMDLSAIRSAAREGAATAIAQQQQEALSELQVESAASPSTSASQSVAVGKMIGPEKPPTPAAVVQVAPENAAQNVSLRAANVKGQDNAPITIIEFSDFNCGYCLRFYQQTYPAIVEQYVTTGKAKIIYKQFAILGDASVLAANASECAADQNQFWAYHDALFAMRVAGQGFSPESLIASAGELKLDTAQFTSCLNDNQTAPRVQTDLGEAQNLGFRGTPTFIINGKVVVGAQPFQVFQQELDKALAQKN